MIAIAISSDAHLIPLNSVRQRQYIQVGPNRIDVVGFATAKSYFLEHTFGLRRKTSLTGLLPATPARYCLCGCRRELHLPTLLLRRQSNGDESRSLTRATHKS